MKKAFLTLVLAACCMAGCQTVDNERISGFRVYIDLGSYALWNTYGVNGVGDYSIFNRLKGIPANFPYNVNTYTGFGGVLLIMGLDSEQSSYEPLAYDAACPVENDYNISVTIDPESLEAICPSCKSHYNVVTGMGGPIAGKAQDKRLGLRNYAVRQSSNTLGGYIITNR